MSMRATPEQRIVVQSKAKLLIVKAFAGTGKTTTLVEYAKARPKARILYLAYNKPIQLAAAVKFPKNVACKTTHSLAYARFGRPYADAQKLGNVRSTDLMMTMKLDGVFSKGVLETVNNFIYSADAALVAEHVPSSVLYARRGEALEVAKDLWSAMCAMPGEHPLAAKIRMTHDGYLKLYHLSKPDLSKSWDCVMLDEYQDSNPVTSDIVTTQTCTRVLVGDSHQAIYGFRKSVGGMDAAAALPGAEVCYLTASFRFGPDIAALATALLTGFKDETRPLIGAGGALRIATKVDRSERYITICRTNASVFRAAAGFLGNKKVNFIGGVASYPFERLVDLQRLASGQLHQVQDAFFKSMGSLPRLQEYVNKVKDPEIGALLSVQKEYGPRIPGLVHAIQEAAVETEAESDAQLSTAHRCKGLEWKQVVMCPDFEEFEVEGGAPRFLDTQELVEELNLLYVAATRASHALEINDSIILALKALGTTDYGLPEGTPESDWVDALIEGGEIPEQECELRVASTPTPVAPAAAVAAVAAAPAPVAAPVAVAKPAAVPTRDATAPVRTVVVNSGNPFAAAAKAAISDDVRIEPVAGAVIVAAEKQLKPWLDRTRFRRT